MERSPLCMIMQLNIRVILQLIQVCFQSHLLLIVVGYRLVYNAVHQKTLSPLHTVLQILRDILLLIHDYTYYIFLILGLAVVFSGPSRTADDVISRDVPWLQRSGYAIVFSHILYRLCCPLPQIACFVIQQIAWDETIANICHDKAFYYQMVE